MIKIKIQDENIVILIPVNVFNKLFESRTQKMIEQTVEQIADGLTTYDNRRQEITGEDKLETP